MPDILTHAYCADMARRSIEDTLIYKQFIDQNISAFYLGAQGPDIFYYYGIWPWKNDDFVPEFADLVHKSKTTEFLTTAFSSLKEEDFSTKQGQMRLAYWMGFLSHYALDTTAHPFIHYFAGINDDELSAENGDNNHHKYLENILDSLLVERYSATPDLPKNQYACLPDSVSKLRPIYEHLTTIFDIVFDKAVTPKTIEASVDDMTKLIKKLNDPKFRRRRLFKHIEKAISKPQYITTAAFPAAADYNLDFMNLQHKTWLHPCDSAFEYKDSFPDIFEKAITRTNDFMQFAWGMVKGQYSENAFSGYLGNLSYDTGLACGDPRILKHSSSIFKTVLDEDSQND